MDSRPHLSIKEAADYLGLSEKTFYRLVNEGKVRGAFKLGGRWFVDREVFTAHLKELAEKPKPRLSQTDSHRDRHSLA